MVIIIGFIKIDNMVGIEEVKQVRERMWGEKGGRVREGEVSNIEKFLSNFFIFIILSTKIIF